MRQWQILAVLLGMSLATAAFAQSAPQRNRSGDHDRACHSEPACGEARLKRVEQEARELGREERFECERQRLERLEQECGATFSANQRARLRMLQADNAFHRGDFPRCRELLRDSRPPDASLLVRWAESTGRCGGDCGSADMHTACGAGSVVYKQLTAGEPKR